MGQVQRRLSVGKPSGNLKTPIQDKQGKKSIIAHRSDNAPRYTPAKTPTSPVYPGLLASGKRAKPTGMSITSPRVIGVGTRSVGEPLTGGRGFF